MCRLLYEVGIPGLRSLFKLEVDSDLLGSILRVLDAHMCDIRRASELRRSEDTTASSSSSCTDNSSVRLIHDGVPATEAAAFGVDVALLLSKGGMFDLARDFLTKDDLAAVSSIAATAIDLSASSASDVSSLRAAYRVPKVL